MLNKVQSYLKNKENNENSKNAINISSHISSKQNSTEINSKKLKIDINKIEDIEISFAFKDSRIENNSKFESINTNDLCSKSNNSKNINLCQPKSNEEYDKNDSVNEKYSSDINTQNNKFISNLFTINESIDESNFINILNSSGKSLNTEYYSPDEIDKKDNNPDVEVKNPNLSKS